jgi:hypothetical protein
LIAEEGWIDPALARGAMVSSVNPTAFRMNPTVSPLSLDDPVGRSGDWSWVELPGR